LHHARSQSPHVRKKATARSAPVPVTSCRAPPGVRIPGLGSPPPASVKEPVSLLVCRQEGCTGGVKLRCTVPQVYEVDGECNCNKQNPGLRTTNSPPRQPPIVESPPPICDSYTASCPADRPVVDNASSVVCTGGACGTPQCCKPEVTCDSYITSCPAGQPVVDNASRVVCVGGACGTSQCCKRPTTTTTTTTIDNQCPRNFPKGRRCDRTCQCAAPNLCGTGIFSLFAPKTCHC
jgi:hypothetical protein